MKKISNNLIFIVVFSLPLITQAQWIQSLTVSPVNPSTTDTIFVYANCDFPSGNCNDKTQFISINPPVINASALHCLGIAAFICNETDTFKINPLPAGNYNFIFSVSAGIGTTPCNPGIVPGPIDSVSFTVTDATGIINEEGSFNGIKVVPGSKSGCFEIVDYQKILDEKANRLTVYNVNGQKIFEKNNFKAGLEIDLSIFESGIYFIEITGSGLHKKLFKIILP